MIGETKKCLVCGEDKPYIELYYALKVHDKRLKEACKVCLVKLFGEHETKENVLNVIYPNPGLTVKQIKKKKRSQYKTEFMKARKIVLKRDNNKCVYCGSNYEINVHHKVERSKGGTNDLNNLVTLCYYCHMKEHEGENVHKVMESRCS